MGPFSLKTLPFFIFRPKLAIQTHISEHFLCSTRIKNQKEKKNFFGLIRTYMGWSIWELEGQKVKKKFFLASRAPNRVTYVFTILNGCTSINHVH